MRSTIIPAALLCLLFLGLNTHAQKHFEKGITLKASLLMPQSNFGELTDALDEINRDVIRSNSNSTIIRYDHSNQGYGFQFGSMFFLDGIPMGDHLSLGLDATFVGLQYQSARYTAVLPDEQFRLHYFYITPEFGPFLSFSPVDDLAFDVAFKFSPTGILSLGGYTGTYTVANQTIESTDFLLGFGGGLRYTPAFYARFNIFMLGFEANYGSVYQWIGSSETGASYTENTDFSTYRVFFGFKL